MAPRANRTQAKAGASTTAPAAASDANAAAQSSGTPDASAPAQEVTSLSAVTDKNGQVTPDSPQATPVVGIRSGVMDPRQYASTGEGWQPGQVASKDVWQDLETDKIVTKAPERGQVLAIKGSPVEPWAARVLSEAKFSG